MSTRLAVLVVALAVFGSAEGGPQPGRWDEYTPSTFTAALMRTKFTSECAICLTPGLPYLIEVKYLGRSRPITESRRTLVHHWQKSIRKLEGHEDLFSIEILVVEGGQERWLPIQRQVFPYLEKEQPNGGPIELYAVLIGASAANGPNEDYVFVVNEFHSLNLANE